MTGLGAREEPRTAALSHLRLQCCADGGPPENVALQGAAITAPLILSRLPTAAEPRLRCRARLAGGMSLTSQPRRYACTQSQLPYTAMYLQVSVTFCESCMIAESRSDASVCRNATEARHMTTYMTYTRQGSVQCSTARRTSVWQRLFSKPFLSKIVAQEQHIGTCAAAGAMSALWQAGISL